MLKASINSGLGVVGWTDGKIPLNNDFREINFLFSFVADVEVRAALVGSGSMISLCTCLTQLDQNFVQSFGVFLLDHILLIVLKYLSDEATVNIYPPTADFDTFRRIPFPIESYLFFATLRTGNLDFLTTFYFRLFRTHFVGS